MEKFKAKERHGLICGSERRLQPESLVSGRDWKQGDLREAGPCLLERL